VILVVVSVVALVLVLGVFVGSELLLYRRVHRPPDVVDIDLVGVRSDPDRDAAVFDWRPRLPQIEVSSSVTDDELAAFRRKLASTGPRGGVSCDARPSGKPPFPPDNPSNRGAAA
jgi:hypothetical protein